MPRFETDPLSTNGCTRLAEKFQNLGITAELNPDFLKNPVGMGLQFIQILIIKNLNNRSFSVSRLRFGS